MLCYAMLCYAMLCSAAAAAVSMPLSPRRRSPRRRLVSRAAVHRPAPVDPRAALRQGHVQQDLRILAVPARQIRTRAPDQNPSTSLPEHLPGERVSPSRLPVVGRYPHKSDFGCAFWRDGLCYATGDTGGAGSLPSSPSNKAHMGFSVRDARWRFTVRRSDDAPRARPARPPRERCAHAAFS